MKMAVEDQRSDFFNLINEILNEQFIHIGGRIKFCAQRKKPRVRVYDLSAMQLVDDAPINDAKGFDFGATDHDYFVVVTPT